MWTIPSSKSMRAFRVRLSPTAATEEEPNPSYRRLSNEATVKNPGTQIQYFVPAAEQYFVLLL